MPLTDLTFPPSAKRFASFLHREYCVWMPSPSLALLSALVTGKGRPKHLLVTENAPAFISKIGIVTGAAVTSVKPNAINEVLGSLLRDEGLSPGQVWAVATHREGKLAPGDWISKCAASGVPTIELCLGSLRALARPGLSPAMFTIVDLDAEAAFAGARLTALLTSDPSRAARVGRLCLPGAEAQDYVFDAGPRGLTHDEPALASLVERVMARSGELALPGQWKGQALVTADRSQALQSQLDEQRSSTEEWRRRFQAAESQAAAQAERDSALLADAKKTLVERERTIDELGAGFRAAEAEAERNAAGLASAGADLGAQKNEFERALASTQAQSEALAQQLRQTESDRDGALAEVARKSESERLIRAELLQRAEQFEKDAAALRSREEAEAEAARVSKSELAAEVARLEKDASALGLVRDDLQKDKADAEQALASTRAEKQDLTSKLKDLDAELGEALAEAAQRAAEQRTALDKQNQRAAQLEKEIATLTAREAVHLREREAAQAETMRREEAQRSEIGQLKSRAEHLGSQTATFSRAAVQAAQREEAQRSEIANQKSRLEQLE